MNGTALHYNLSPMIDCSTFLLVVVLLQLRFGGWSSWASFANSETLPFEALPSRLAIISNVTFLDALIMFLSLTVTVRREASSRPFGRSTSLFLETT